jgi:hypothetical protein
MLMMEDGSQVIDNSSHEPLVAGDELKPIYSPPPPPPQKKTKNKTTQ